MRQAAIVGLSGTVLTADEADLLRTAQPAGVILFKRNAEAPDQVRRLVGDARNAIGADEALVLIDQEGGRVQRLGPPHWHDFPSAGSFGRRYIVDPEGATAAARCAAQLCALELRQLGINTNCVPCLDLLFGDTHGFIAERAYGGDVGTVTVLARVVGDAHLASGVLPVIKHMPGHGRAMVDSHYALPRIPTSVDALSATDFATFRELSDLPAGMTGHVVFEEIDPGAPATQSQAVIDQIVRCRIGFDGLLMTDDLSMQALAGELGDRAGRSIAAGCDIALHCNGDLAEMEAVIAAVPKLSGQALSRFQRAAEVTARPALAFDNAAAEEVLASHVSQYANSRM